MAEHRREIKSDHFVLEGRDDELVCQRVVCERRWHGIAFRQCDFRDDMLFLYRDEYSGHRFYHDERLDGNSLIVVLVENDRSPICCAPAGWMLL